MGSWWRRECKTTLHILACFQMYPPRKTFAEQFCFSVLEKCQLQRTKLSALQRTWPDWLSCAWCFQLINSISSLSYPLFSPPSSPASVAWVYSSSLTEHSTSVIPPLPLFLPPFTISLSLSLWGWGNTIDIFPTWLPDTVSTPFLLHPSSLLQPLPFLSPPPASRSSPLRLLGLKQSRN